MLLPNPPNRIHLISFWIVICFYTGMLLEIIHFLLFNLSIYWLLSEILVLLFLGIIVTLNPRKLLSIYLLWNKIEIFLTKHLKHLLMRVCFFIIFTSVGKAGTKMMLGEKSSNSTLWIKRGTLDPDAYSSQYDIAASSKKGWIADFVFWAFRPQNIWVLFTFPYFLLIRLFNDEEKVEFPQSIYTLY